MAEEAGEVRQVATVRSSPWVCPEGRSTRCSEDTGTQPGGTDSQPLGKPFEPLDAELSAVAQGPGTGIKLLFLLGAVSM